MQRRAEHSWMWYLDISFSQIFLHCASLSLVTNNLTIVTTTPPYMYTFSQTKSWADGCMSEYGSPSPGILPSWALLCQSWTGCEWGPTPSAAASREDQGGSRLRWGGSYRGAGVNGGTGLKLDLLMSQLTHIHWPAQKRAVFITVLGATCLSGVGWSFQYMYVVIGNHHKTVEVSTIQMDAYPGMCAKLKSQGHTILCLNMLLAHKLWAFKIINVCF